MSYPSFGVVSKLNRNGDNMTVSRMKRLLIGAATVSLSLGIGLAGSSSVGAGVDKNESNVYTLPPPFTLVDGASVDSRITRGGVNISIHTNGLEGGNAYTLWSISFSHPEHCTHGNPEMGLLCGMGDDGLGPQGWAMQQVGGHIAGASGNVTISGHVEVDNAAGAEFHIVVADHGPLDPSIMPTQIKSPGPGVQIGFLVP
jgi:hypothetical protein